MSAPYRVGLYGKLPSHGDFLRRRVSDGFVAVWDAWLQESLTASREALTDRWLDVYLTSPAWRFACAPRACGAAPVVGVMVPSVDRVGRYFPLTIVAELEMPEITLLVSSVTEAESFFDNAEQLLVETLAAEQVEFGRFDEQVAALTEGLRALRRPPRVVLDAATGGIPASGTPAGLQMLVGSTSNLGAVLQQLLSRQLSAVYDPLVLWWTDGSSIVEPSCLVMRGLPPPEGFAALLDGSWAERHWQSIPARVEEDSADDTLIEETRSLHFRSAASSDVGRVREINQDAFIERPEVGVWAVADGLGGHHHGEVASRMVCDALADLVPDSDFEDVLEGASRRLCEMNEYLRESPSAPVDSGSTVVALFARGRRCAVLWAGDSRMYRLRDGQLEQLTHDHSLAALDPVGHGESHLVTRAVGGEPELALDLRRDQVAGGDRFLLCSDGLTGVLPEAEIRVRMGDPNVRDAVDGLISATLEGGAPDNVTALVVEAYH